MKEPKREEYVGLREEKGQTSRWRRQSKTNRETAAVEIERKWISTAGKGLWEQEERKIGGRDREKVDLYRRKRPLGARRERHRRER